MQPTKTKSAPTIRDVAEAAAVSVGTASNVLRGKHDLHAEETVQRVRSAAAALGYRKNAVARSLVQRRTRTLGVLLEPYHGRLTSNSYLTSIVDGFLEFAVGAGYQLKIVTLTEHDFGYVMAQIDDGSIDGVLMVAPPSTSPVIGWVREARVAAVVAGSVLPDMKIPCVDVDDEPAFYDLTVRLARLGHRRIGLIAGPVHQYSALRRERGFLRALADCGLDAAPRRRYRGDYTGDSGTAGVQAILEADPYTSAIVCSNDGVAIGALKCLAERGVRVPQDVSVVGFDGDVLGQYSAPPLTTMRQPAHEIGRRAAELLIEEIRTGRRLDRVDQLPAEFVERDSMGPAPKPPRAADGAEEAPNRRDDDRQPRVARPGRA